MRLPISVANRFGSSDFTVVRHTITYSVVAILGLAVWTNSARAIPLEWSAGSGGNGHFYEAMNVPSGISWSDAEAQASLLQFDGVQGYLATITSAAENNFVFSAVADNPSLWNGQGPWLGGYRDPSDPNYSQDPNSAWHWVTGEPWSYVNWAPGEPNQGFSTPTNYLQYFIDTTLSTGDPAPYWNDTFDTNPNPSQPVLGYIVEFSVLPPTVSSGVPEPVTTVLSILSLGVIGWIASARRWGNN